MTKPTNRSQNGVRRARTVVLGLDAVDLSLVQRWAAAGHLPFFRALLAECPLVRLTALSRNLQGALWPSVLTGVSPGDHGRYSFAQLVPGTYHVDETRADWVKAPRFYAEMKSHGLQCVAIDIPSDLPDPSFPGIQVVDWGTEFTLWEFATQPVEFKDHIVTRYGRHYLTDDPSTGETVADHRKLVVNLTRGVLQKSALTQELLRRPDVDLLFVVYGEPHKAGHFLWKYMDEDHPDHVATPDLGSALRGIYELIDRELAALAHTLEDDDNLLVFSDHGMQANYRGEHHLGQILERLGLMGTLTTEQPGLDSTASPRALRTSATALRRRLHAMVRKIAPTTTVRKLRDKYGAASRVRWNEVKAFPLPTDRNSYIRINLRGREPQGTVSPGAEYQQLLDRIEREFSALVNAETGEPAVEAVYRVQEIYPGPRSQELPDLAVLWRSESPINVLQSRSLGRIEARVVEQRSGNHRPEGFLLARGPRFVSGQRTLHADALQIAPTLLALHDVPVPGRYAMGPIDELFALSVPV